VGNETEWLDACLSRLSLFTGPIVVVGSQEESKLEKTCEYWGARFFLRRPGTRFSFAEQRNQLFEVCPTPWILMVDVDEWVGPEGLNEALAISETHPDRAYCVRHPYRSTQGLWLVDCQPRLMPGDGSMPFEGFVQNTLEAEHLAPEKIYLGNMVIEDRGALLEPDLFEHRRLRNGPLRKEELKRLSALGRANDPGKWGRLGFRYFCLGIPRAARYFFNRLAVREPDHQAAQFYLARLEVEREPEGLDSAIRRLWGLLEKGSTHFRIYRYLVEFHGRLGQWPEALRAAEAGAAIHPACASVQHYLSVAHYHNGNLPEAGEALDRCLRLYPGYQPVQTLSRLLAREGWTDRSLVLSGRAG